MLKINSQNALELIHLTKDFPGVRALHDISFVVKEGSIHGFLGPNGAGKSTTMNIIAGLFPATSGEVKYFSQSEKVTIGFLPENPPLYGNMQVADYLLFVAEIHNFDAQKLKPRLNKVLAKCGLENVSGRLIRNLSKGYKQRVGMAQAIIHEPKIIILDEPTVGLDPNAIVEIRELILNLAKEHTVLLSTHQLHEAQLLCSDITIINAGRIIQSGTFANLKDNLKAKNLLQANVKNWDGDIERRFHHQFPVLDFNTKIEKNSILLSASFLAADDFRAEMSKFLVDHHCQLLSFREENLDLEDVFKLLTKKLDKSKMTEISEEIFQ